MLAKLKIKDFAIIDDVEINFKDNMTVLTGETGSGKSIIIDAIELLLGERASTEMIRHDKERAIIEGLFYFTNSAITSILDDFGIPYDDTLIIVREISKNGRNICRLNGGLVTVNQLKQLGSHLVDVHVQHDTTRLINTNNYLYLIDSLSDERFNHLLTDYRNVYDGFLVHLRKYKGIIKETKSNKEKIDFYKFQLEEFKQAKINLEEYNELTNRRNLISNYDKIYENLNKANNNIKDNRVLESIYEAGNHLGKIASVNEVYAEMSEQLLNIYYQLEDAATTVSDEVLGLDYNPSELDAIELRLSVYSQLKRKYKLEVEELIEQKESLQEKIDNIDNFDFIIKDLEKQLKMDYEVLYDKANALRNYRIEIAEEIKQALILHLQDLKLANTTFNIVFNEIEEDRSNYLDVSAFNEFGFDEVDFHVSFNKGEPARALSKVASGGEMSRFMLGLKTILTQKQHLSTMVFDEIDTGVSGMTASAIANKIKAISKNVQVLCITHLPQVASVADHHLSIYKDETNDRTNTYVSDLDQEMRIHEIAKMIAGEELNDYAIENAKNLLRINN